MDTIDKILKLMGSNGISAFQLSQEAGISNGLITQWKQRKQNPSIKNIKKIAQYFGVPWEELMADGESNAPKDYSTLIQHAQQLSNQMVLASKDLRDLLEKRNMLLREKTDLENKIQAVVHTLGHLGETKQEAFAVRELQKLAEKQEEIQQEGTLVEQKLTEFYQQNTQLYIFIMISELNKQGREKVYKYVNSVFMEETKNNIAKENISRKYSTDNNA